MANVQGGVGGALSGAVAGQAAIPIPGVGAALGGLVGGIAGLVGGGGPDYDKQMQILQQITGEIDALPVPSVEAQEVVLDKYRSAGVLTPEMENTIKQGPSAMAGISTDPRLRQAQMGALASLQQVGKEGFTPEQEAASNALTRQVAQQENAREQGILRQMQQRGVGGSGAELAAQLSSSQAAAESQAAESDKIKAQAYQNALSAISQSGQLGGQMEQQQFGEAAQKANAADVINAANTANARAVQQYNTGTANQAQAANLSNAQNIMNQNTGLSNQEQIYNKQLLQQQYQDQLAKQNAKANAMGNYAKGEQSKGAAADTSLGGMMSGMATAGTALAGAMKPKDK